MARKVLNSRLFSARNFILAENMQFRSSPLLVAAKRCASAYKKMIQKEDKIKRFEELYQEIHNANGKIKGLGIPFLLKVEIPKREDYDKFSDSMFSSENESILKHLEENLYFMNLSLAPIGLGYIYEKVQKI